MTARVRSAVPGATVTAVDLSSEMLHRARERFAGDDRVEVRRHDLDDRLPPEWGRFDLVASATPELHAAFLAGLGTFEADDDPSNKLASVEIQLEWLRVIGFTQVDCHDKWREIALLGGDR